MAIGLAASVFQQNLLLQRKVLNQLEQTQLQQVVTRNVLFQLEQKKLSGKEVVNLVEINWKADVEKKAAFIDSYSFDTEKYSADLGHVTVYIITLTSEHWPDWSVEYKESIWTP
ncbi:putative general secretion pathway protein [Aliivibrio wodanis]|uniref:Putative general secretion pathway protein n=1 Tax=Aliivibrio wodanis TaxID=80852 RepID=A0A090IPS4_9GAMM|nr:putative general secretion pathway protein [Aliivibrio wodanis]